MSQNLILIFDEELLCMSKMDFQYLILTRQKCTVQCETANTRSRILAIAHKGDAKTISGEPFL
jgi:hypothetical protein